MYCRYSDIIVHRLLAVCIGADASYPELTDKYKTQVGAQFEYGGEKYCAIFELKIPYMVLYNISKMLQNLLPIHFRLFATI